MPYPDYNNSLVNLVGRILLRFDGTCQDYLPLSHTCLDDIKNRRNIILLVIDGLGYDYVDSQPGFLNSNLQIQLDSVFPPTTASSITTFLTGQAPSQHGLTGWFVYLREIGAVTAVLPFTERGSMESLTDSGFDIQQIYGHTPLFDLLDTESYVVSPDWIIASPFNRSHTGRATGVPYTDMAGMCEAIKTLAKAPGEKYVYAYWSEFDALSHRYGNRSDVVKQHYLVLENSIASLCQELRGTDSLLLITADHGFIDTSPEQMITVNQHPRMHECLRLPLSGEPRFAYCHLYQDKVEQFLDYVNNTFAEQLECIQSSTLVEQGVFGRGENHPALLERVGDYVLRMKHNHVIKDWLIGEKPFFHLGVHGGNSLQEVSIPLIALEL